MNHQERMKRHEMNERLWMIEWLYVMVGAVLCLIYCVCFVVGEL